MQKWNFYTSKEIQPKGWIKRQLEIQANGLSGNLDKMWRDVKDSAWIGGEAEGWERVPYWLDGFIPLAYLLKNEDMIARAKKYINAIISNQRESGWICPCTDDFIPHYDSWAVQLISKVLVVYYECSGDERIPEIVYKIMKNYYDLLSSGSKVLFYWDKARWFESFISLNFLYKRYNEEWIKDLATILKKQGLDYSLLTDKWKTPYHDWEHSRHIVNIAMMLKYEAVSCDLLGEDYQDIAEKLHTILKEYNGTAVGTFTGDECLAGLSPINGTELCAVAEQMYSYEWILAYSGDDKWRERLEMLAFNALPATLSDDMWTHQYDQMSNQIACQKLGLNPHFTTNNIEAHLFGLEPNYGCCTANFNQAWPKFALSSFMYNDNTVFSAIPIPSRLKTKDIDITLKTNYPFDNNFEYIVKTKKDIKLKVNIPSFAKNLVVNGNPTTYSEELIFDITKNQKTVITLSYNVLPTLVDRPHDLKCVKCGSLVFSVPIKYEKVAIEYVKDGVERKFPYCDYEFIPKSDWNYALSSPFFEVERHKISSTPFSSTKPAVTIKAKVKNIPWGLEDGFLSVCAKIPKCRIPISKEKTIKLYPYGSSKLRITELPLI